ncbi:MAG: SLC13/DASS family transporter [Candidatus Nitronauta litoralis]|uniref:SLC13/DASS family transporter n=1 Tax=Candidatus Nitronauta litoralis TaxID=2705533 RepID=A0A7T0BZJ9_9BACT|nr:MAG: SLC13/DASS family transporter [Candidatus Nitronauta litoralis]
MFTGVVAFFLILVMPVPDGLEAPARNMMAVAALMAIWWLGEAVPIPVTALLPLVLYPLLGILPSSKVGPFYGHHLIFLYLGGFMIGLAMQRAGLHRRFALNVIQFVGTELKRLVLGFMVACAFLSMWVSNTATTLLLLPVAMAVVRQVASCAVIEGKNDEEAQGMVISGFGLVLMLGLGYSASIGGVGTLIGTPPNIIFAGFWKLQFPGREEISFLSWMLVALPLVVLFLPLVWWILCRFVSPIPLDQVESSDQAEQIIQREVNSLGTMSRAESFVAGVFATTSFLWIFRKPISLGSFSLPGWSGLLPWPDFPHDATVAVGMGLLLMIVPLKLFDRTEKSSGDLNQKLNVALDWDTFCKGVPWGILLLFGGGFALAGGFRATGLDVWIGNHLAGVQHWPLWMVVLGLCLGLTFLTEMTSNTATATMILPVIASAAEAAGIEPLILLVPATLSVSCAFMMPVATPPNAIVFSSGWVTIPQMAKAGVILNLVGAVLITFITLLLVPMILF